MADENFRFFEFGEFTLDPRQRSLSKSGEKIAVSARNFDLLLFMVENGGRILEHDELLDKVWAGTFVEQATLKKGISAIRQILGERPDLEFIKTIPRRGYSFVSPVRAVPIENEVVYVRQTEQQIIIEEFEEEDAPANETIVLPEVNAVQSLPTAQSTKTGSRRLALAMGGLAIAVLVVFAGFFGVKAYRSRHIQPQFAVENVRITRITNSGKVVSGTSVSPDGAYLIYPTAEKEGSVLWVRQVLTNSERKLTTPAAGGFYAFAVAPDNSYVYYIFNNEYEPQKTGMYKVPLLGGEPQRIVEGVSSLAISPDGKQIAVVRLTDVTTVEVIDTNGGPVRTAATFPAGSRLWYVSWTPDGSSLLYTVRKIVDGKFLFYISEISPEDGKETVILALQEKNIFCSVWLPDKSGMLTTLREPNADIRQIWQFFPSSGEWRRVTNDNNSYKNVNLTRDGKTIVTSQESRLAAIWTTDASPHGSDGRTATIPRDDFRQITPGVSNFDKLGWLADGRLMYSGTEDGKESIFSINADGSDARQVTSGEDGLWISPSIAGNGQSICFTSTRGGSKQAWSIGADGRNPLKLTDHASPVISARILRDGVTVIYLAQSSEGPTVVFRHSSDGSITPITNADTGFWAISPDEKLLAAEVYDKDSRKYHIEIRSMDDAKVIKTIDGGGAHQLSFTPDGKQIAYDVRSGEDGQIIVQPIDGGKSSILTEFHADGIFSFDWSRDGKTLAIVRGKQLNDAVLIKAKDRE